MKLNIKKLILPCITLTITIGAGIYGLSYFGYLGNSSIDYDILKLPAGTSFKIPEVKKAPNEAKSFKNIVEVPLMLDSNRCYNISIGKDSDYVSDYSKYLYFKDNSVSVMVLSNLNRDNFSQLTGVRHPQSLTKDIIRSKEGSKIQEAAVYLDGTAVFVNCYNNPKTFATILDGMERNKPFAVDYNIDTIMKSSINKYQELPKAIKSNKDVVLSLKENQYYRIFNTADGFVAMGDEYLTYEDAIDKMIKKIVQVSGYTPNKELSTQNLYYDENYMFVVYDDYTAGVVHKNYNTSITFFAKGNYARNSILLYMDSVE